MPLTFTNPADYEKITEDDRLSILGLRNLAPAKSLQLTIYHANGKSEEVSLLHSLTAEQIAWFKAGSALNLMKDA